MSDDAPKAPAGWYPAPDGSQRYWDGEQWLSLPAPSSGGHDTPDKPAHRESPPRKKRTVIVAGIVAGVLTIAVVTTGIVWKMAVDAAEEAKTAELLENREKTKAAAEAAEQQRQQEREAREREDRQRSVAGIEDAIGAMAEGHAADGIIEGPILDVTCSPLGGGSTDDLTEKTTTFDCFVANRDNGDGTMTGVKYGAIMNWDTGQYTYGLGTQ